MWVKDGLVLDLISPQPHLYTYLSHLSPHPTASQSFPDRGHLPLLALVSNLTTLGLMLAPQKGEAQQLHICYSTAHRMGWGAFLEDCHTRPGEPSGGMRAWACPDCPKIRQRVSVSWPQRKWGDPGGRVTVSLQLYRTVASRRHLFLEQASVWNKCTRLPWKEEHSIHQAAPMCVKHFR